MDGITTEVMRFSRSTTKGDGACHSSGCIAPCMAAASGRDERLSRSLPRSVAGCDPTFSRAKGFGE